MPPAVNPTMSAPEWAMLLCLSVLWGGSFFVTQVALDALPPVTLVVLRVGLAALILNAVVPLSGLAMPRGARVWAAFLGMGLLNNAVERLGRQRPREGPRPSDAGHRGSTHLGRRRAMPA